MNTVIFGLWLVILGGCPVDTFGPSGAVTALSDTTINDTAGSTSTSGSGTANSSTTPTGTSTNPTGTSETVSASDATDGAESIGDTIPTIGDAGETDGVPPVCGDGVLQMEEGEGCDAGDANADDAACTSQCQPASCGDSLVQAGVEVCDDGVNDGSYNGCAIGCIDHGPYCGDGIVQAPHEQCDDANAASGCLPETCMVAKSCKQIKDAYGDMVFDGIYTIAPLGFKVQVVCDMDADGGGYTFLKLAQPAPVSAKTAEIECAKYGMRLMVPRSKAHLSAMVLVALADALPPIGVGPKASTDYLQIFGIYPKVAGQSCPGKPLNHLSCPQWTAVGDVFWISDQALAAPYQSEPGSKTNVLCSLAYFWAPNGVVVGYESVIGTNSEGYQSELFLCEVPDMLPMK